MLTHTQPHSQVPRESKRNLPFCADGRVDCERVESVHGGVVDRTDDPGGADDVPRRGRIGLAIIEQKVFLRVVEVWLKSDAGVGFMKGRAGAA